MLYVTTDGSKMRPGLQKHITVVHSRLIKCSESDLGMTPNWSVEAKASAAMSFNDERGMAAALTAGGEGWRDIT